MDQTLTIEATPTDTDQIACRSLKQTLNSSDKKTRTTYSLAISAHIRVSNFQIIELRHAQTISISIVLQWSSQHREIWWSSPPSTTSTCMPTPLVPSIPCLHWSNALTSAFTWFRDFTLHDLSVFETSYNLRAWKLKFPYVLEWEIPKLYTLNPNPKSQPSLYSLWIYVHLFIRCRLLALLLPLDSHSFTSHPSSPLRFLYWDRTEGLLP